MGFRLKILLLFPLLWAHLAFAGVEQISEKEFQDLAHELSTKVNLFKAGWEKDPAAEFYGGTTRDYLYWLKGQFVNAHNPAQAEAVVKKLKQVPVIDVRDFIIGDSDVDIISKQLGSLRAEDFGVRKIDAQSPDILNPATELGKNEMLQGYIPAEKIRLAQDGFHPSTLGNGIKEIYNGKLSVHFASAEDFARSKYAQEGVNHPVLLSLRYLRLQAINYYRTHGKGFPDPAKLHSGMDEASAKAVKAVIDSVVETGELRSYLTRDRFKSWINGAIQKAFRSYTNPTAALQLMKEFGVDKLAERYPQQIETLNQYVFTKFHDPSAVKAALEKYGVEPQKLYTPAETFFPDGRIYHGTKTEPAFRGIIFQGVLPSEHGSASGGLYGVAVGNRAFSENWAGDKNRLLSFAMDPKAKIVDLTTGEGAHAWNAFHEYGVDKYDAFADIFGADVLKYPYGNIEAFVVKNGGVLSDGQGVYRSVMSLSALIEKAKNLPIEKIVDLLSVNALSTSERDMVWDAANLKWDKVLEYAKSQENFLGYKNPQQAVTELLGKPQWVGGKEVGEFLKTWMLSKNPEQAHNQISVALDLIAAVPQPDADRLALLDQLTLEKSSPEDFKTQVKLLHYIREHAHPQPLGVEAGLRAYENYAQDYEKRGASAVDPVQYAKYLSEAKLSAEQLNRLDKLQAKLLGRSHEIEFLPTMLRNGHKKDEIKKEILTRLAAWNSQSPEAELDELLGAVNPFFVNDPEMEEAVLKFFTTRLKQIRPLDVGRIHSLAMIIKNSNKSRAYLLESLNGVDRENAQSALSKIDLNDHELVRFLDSFPYNAKDKNALSYYLQTHKAPPSSEAVKAMVRAFMRVRGEGSFSHILQLKFLISAYPDPPFLQSYLEEILSNPEKMVLVSNTYATTKTQEVSLALELIEGGIIPSTPTLDEKLLTYLENHVSDLQYDHDAYKIVSRQNLEDSAIAHRVMKLIGQVQFPKSTDLGALLRRMPKDCPAAYGFLIND